MQRSDRRPAIESFCIYLIFSPSCFDMSFVLSTFIFGSKRHRWFLFQAVEEILLFKD